MSEKIPVVDNIIIIGKALPRPPSPQSVLSAHLAALRAAKLSKRKLDSDQSGD